MDYGKPIWISFLFFLHKDAKPGEISWIYLCFSGGFRIETQMEFCIKDVKAFTELSENGDEMRDFSKFSKIPLPVNIVGVITNLIKCFQKRRLCSRQISKYFSNSSGRKTSRRKLSKYDSDYASNYLWYRAQLGLVKLGEMELQKIWLKVIAG